MALFANVSNKPDNTFATRNWVDNNIFAWSGSNKSQIKETIHRGGDNPETFYFTRNAIYNNGKGSSTCSGGKATFQNCPGTWSPYDCSGNPVPSTGRWFWDYNLLFDKTGTTFDFVISNPATPSGVCTIGGTTYTYTHVPFATWQSTYGQDVNSKNQNPTFVNPTYPTDNYLFSSQSVLNLVGMQNFNYTDAGLFDAASLPQDVTVPTGFPVTLLNPSTDF